MTILEAIPVFLTIVCGVYYLMLYFKMDKIESKVNEIKRKMEEEGNDKRRSN
jgi:hypothetical protein